MIKAVIYARYSSHNQREESIEDQLRVCSEYAASKDMIVVDTYCDAAISGKTDLRPEFQKMIRDSSSKTFNAVIVYKMDRFARNRYDSVVHKNTLKKNGVKVVYAKEGIPEGPEGILMEAILEGMAEYYSENLAENIKRGMEGNALKGKANGVPVYGFDIGSDGYYKTNLDEWIVVEKIFTLYASGQTMREICDIIKPARTRKGHYFQPGVLSKMLRSEKYNGVYSFAGIRTEGAMPNQIDPKTWEEVQERLKMTKRRTGGARNTYTLTGKLFCERCGKQMGGTSGKSSSGQKYTYYTCRECRETIRQDLLEEAIFKSTKEALSDEETRNRIATAMYESQKPWEDTEESYEKSLEKRLLQIKTERANLANAIAKGLDSESLIEKDESLKKEYRDIESALTKARIKPARLPESELRLWLHYIAESDSIEKLLDAFVSEVSLGEHEAKVTFNYRKEDGDQAQSSVRLKSLWWRRGESNSGPY